MQRSYNASLSVKTRFNKFPNFGIIYNKSLAHNVLPYKGDVLIDKTYVIGKLIYTFN